MFENPCLAKKVVVSVINDLVTDQRVSKVCSTLRKMGFETLLVGRRMKQSPVMDTRPYRVKRMHLCFEKGPLFYAEFQWRLFVFLLFQKNVSLLVSNDLDTLLPNFLISKIKSIPLVYDSHEYFTGVPELEHHKVKQWLWKQIEAFIFPKLKDVFTVNHSIADLFEKQYGIRPKVVRNVPPVLKMDKLPSREALALPLDKKIMILQGAGININRGAEEMVEAMQWVENAILLIVGGGDVMELLKEMVSRLHLEEKVIFKGRQAFHKLMQYTSASDFGLSLDKPSCLNYQFSLPNKIFDYLQAGIPVVASPLVEIKNIIEKYQVGDFIPNHDPRLMAVKINEIVLHDDWLAQWKKNTRKAAAELNWELESKILIEVYKKYV